MSDEAKKDRGVPNPDGFDRLGAVPPLRAVSPVDPKSVKAGVPAPSAPVSQRAPVQPPPTSPPTNEKK